MFTLLVSLGFAACSDNSDNAELTGESKQYTLSSVAVPTISGTATFEKYDDGSTQVTINLTGTPDGDIHPAHIHFNTAAEGGGIAISLEPVQGGAGTSRTVITETDAGDVITYEELLEFDGYINY